VVDLEYCIGASKPTITPDFVTQKNGSKKRVKQPNYIQKDWDFKMSPPEYFLELFRVSKNQVIFGGNYYGLSGGYLVWDKLNGESDQYGCELAWLSFTKRTDIIYYMWAGMMQGVYCGKNIKRASVQQGNKSLNDKRIHPTQKPIPVYDWIYKEYLPAGGKVLDTHLGSGRNRISADKAGNIEFIGFELDADYYKDQESDWNNYKSQLTLF
jgi:site-specific DNA-methyltransferase (adenine-specific)